MDCINHGVNVMGCMTEKGEGWFGLEMNAFKGSSGEAFRYFLESIG